jgi:hypothetical protein
MVADPYEITFMSKNTYTTQRKLLSSETFKVEKMSKLL